MLKHFETLKIRKAKNDNEKFEIILYYIFLI